MDQSFRREDPGVRGRVWRRFVWAPVGLVGLAVSFVVLLSVRVPDAVQPGGIMKNFDIRESAAPSYEAPRADQLDAVERFRKRVGSRNLTVRFRRNGAVGVLMAYGRPLTDNSDRPSLEIARDFLVKNKDLFGLTDDDIAGLVQVGTGGNQRGKPSGMVFHQFIEGIEVFETSLGFEINRDGAVVSAGGTYFPGLRVKTVNPAISPAEAVRIAIQSVGMGGRDVDLRRIRGPEGTSLDTVFVSDAFRVQIPVNLVVFPLGTEGRLSWKMMIPSKERYIYLYQIIVDALDGTVLQRRGLIRF